MLCRILTILVFTLSLTTAQKCPGTSVAELRKNINNHEISLVFYHSAWSIKSNTAKVLFDELAQVYGQIFQFISVDCWHLQCNCSKTFETAIGSGSPKQWPTLIIHYGKQKIVYSGEWERDALVRYISSLMQPLEKIDTAQELKQLKEASDAIVLGLFENANSVDYHKFVVASLKWLETDPERSFRFAITIGNASINNTFALPENATLPYIRLISDKNETSVFNTARKWQSKDLIQWTQNELKRCYYRVHGYSSPQRLIMRLKKQPTLAIFVNNFNFFKDIKYKYENPYGNACKRSHRSAFTPAVEEINRHLFNSAKKCFQMITNLQTYYEKNELCKILDLYYKHSNPNHADIYGLLQLQRLQKCQESKFQPSPQQVIAASKHIQRSINKLYVEADKHLRPNRTLSVLILSALRHGDFLDTLNIPAQHLSNSISIIADVQQENIYIMPQPHSFKNLQHFVKEYLTQNLHAHRKISSAFYASLHNSPQKQQLQQVNAHQFMQFINSKHINTTIVALFYTPKCAFCGMLSQTLLQVQNLLSQCNDIQFIRLNTDTNDLPWHFSMHESPTLLVFPKGQTSASRAYPLHMQSNVRNILSFILAQLKPMDQVRTAVRSCHGLASNAQHLKSCLDFSKSLIMKHIGEYLRLWQIYEKERNGILEQLRYFKNLDWSIQQAFKT